jgi:hypothetical protein
MAIEVGKKAPAWKLQDADGNTVTLADFAGRDVILYFYPRDDTPGCTKEACGFRDLWAGFKKKKIAVLGISNGFDGGSVMNGLVSTLRSGGVRFTQGYIQENTLQEQVNAARKAVNEADVVIVGLYGRVRSGAKNSVGVPDNGAAVLREALAANKRVIGISFGNPYVLSSFPEMKTYVVAYGDMPSLQRAAARAILGTQDITGRLPITLPDLHPRGTGIQMMKK